MLGATSAVDWHGIVATPMGVLAIAAGVLGFWGTQVMLAPLGNLLPMVPGGAAYRVVYDVARVVAFLGPLVLLRSPILLVTLGGLGALFNVLFVLALRRVVRSFAGSPTDDAITPPPSFRGGPERGLAGLPVR